MNSTRAEQVSTTLDEVRALLSQSAVANQILWAPRFQPHHVAFLATVDALEPRCVILLKQGTNEIGRSCSEYVAFRGALTGVVEASQWRIECDSGVARVEDARSTEGSALLPRRSAPMPLEQARQVGTVTRLGWDGVDAHDALVELGEGSILVNQYRAFAFGWIGSIQAG